MAQASKAGMGQNVLKSPDIGEQQQALAVGIEPTGGMDPG